MIEFLLARSSGDSTRSQLVAAARPAGRPAVPALGRAGSERAHPDQIVGGGGEEEDPVHPVDAPVPQLAQLAHRLHPAEDLFNPFAHPLTHGIPRVPRRAPVDGPAGRLAGDVRRGADGTHRLDEGPLVESFVAADPAPAPARSRSRAPPCPSPPPPQPPRRARGDSPSAPTRHRPTSPHDRWLSAPTGCRGPSSIHASRSTGARRG